MESSFFSKTFSAHLPAHYSSYPGAAAASMPQHSRLVEDDRSKPQVRFCHFFTPTAPIDLTRAQGKNIYIYIWVGVFIDCYFCYDGFLG